MPRPPPGRRGALPAPQLLQTRGGRACCVVSGRGSPALLLFNGAGMTLDGWRRLYPDIESLGTVFAWNRFGVQGSDAPPARQSGAVVLAALRELLGRAGLAPPYVLVAHSLGGLHANLFARLYPAEVAGVLFLEATHPEDRAVLRRHEAQMVRSLGKVLDLPEAVLRPNVHSELRGLGETARAIAVAGAFPPVPVRVVTGGLTPRTWMLSPAAIGARRAHQQELARLSPHGVQVLAHKSGHFPQLTEPRLVLQALRELVLAARSPQPAGHCAAGAGGAGVHATKPP